MLYNPNKFVCIAILMLYFITLASSKHPQIVRCHVCSNVEDLDCDFIHNRDTKFLTLCENIVNEETAITTIAKCVVERDLNPHKPIVTRKCGPTPCSPGAKCCECSKTGCNGDNKCHMVFSGCGLPPKNGFIFVILAVVMEFCLN